MSDTILLTTYVLFVGRQIIVIRLRLVSNVCWVICERQLRFVGPAYDSSGGKQLLMSDSACCWYILIGKRLMDMNGNGELSSLKFVLMLLMS